MNYVRARGHNCTTQGVQATIVKVVLYIAIAGWVMQELCKMQKQEICRQRVGGESAVGEGVLVRRKLDKGVN